MFAKDHSGVGDGGQVVSNDELVRSVQEQQALLVVGVVSVLANLEDCLAVRDAVGIEGCGKPSPVGHQQIKPSAASWQDTGRSDPIRSRGQGADELTPPADVAEPVLPGVLPLAGDVEVPGSSWIDPHPNTVRHSDFPRSQAMNSGVEAGLVGVFEVTDEAGVIKLPDQVSLPSPVGVVNVVGVPVGQVEDSLGQGEMRAGKTISFHLGKDRLENYENCKEK